MATVGEIAGWVGGRVVGDASVPINGVANITDARPDEITYALSPAYVAMLAEGSAGAVFLRADEPGLAIPRILVADPKSAAIQAGAVFHPPLEFRPRCSTAACVAASARVDPSATIMPGAYVGEAVEIGARTVLMPGSVVMDKAVVGEESRLYPGAYIGPYCRVGSRVTLWPNTTIGADGFGYNFEGGRRVKIPQVGIVVIGDDVEIGAGSCVDRATVGRTVIGEGTKIDNQVQVGHNCVIGKHCVLVAHAGLAGSVRVGDYTILAAKAGVVDNVRIGMAAVVGAGSGVLNDVPDGARVAGIPAVPHMEWKRGIAGLRRIGELTRELRRLRERVEALDPGRIDAIKEGGSEPKP